MTTLAYLLLLTSILYAGVQFFDNFFSIRDVDAVLFLLLTFLLVLRFSKENHD